MKPPLLNDHAGPVVFLNIVTPKPGQLDEFIETQVAEQDIFRGKVPGLRDNRVCRSLDSKTAMMIAVFETLDDHKRWLKTDLFAEHLGRIAHLINQTDRGHYEVVYEAGII